MAVIHDSDSNSGYRAALSTYNWIHQCGGDNRILLVGVSILSAGGVVSSITYSGRNLGFLVAAAQGNYRAELWYLVNPSPGQSAIVVEPSRAFYFFSIGRQAI